MPDDTPSSFSVPPDLQARPDAAGVTDPASLEAALQHDPTLAADLQAFAEANAEPDDAATMDGLLNAFTAVADDGQMLAFWRSVPEELEEPLIEAVSGLLAQAEAEGNVEAVAQLRPRLEGFRQIHQAARVQQGENQSPIFQALIAFLQAEDEAAAVALFAAQKSQLQPYEAQRLLDEQITSDDPATLLHLTERRALLLRLRGAAPPLSPSPPLPITPAPPPLTSDLYQAGGDQYNFSAHAESGGTATVVNNLFIQNLERRWTRPTPPVLERDAVPRRVEMDAIIKELRQRGSVAISGRARALTVHGMPGVGKTTVAHLLALELQDAEQYRDGVIWRELGPDFTDPDQAQAVLREWAAYATTFFSLPDNLQKLFRFEPEAVRSLLAERPHLLVILDNVWSQAAIKPLRAALPPGAHLIVTTRKQEIANGLGAGIIEVGLLDPAEALALFDLRLGWQPAADTPADRWAFDLIAVVGRHALGLDVALGVLRNHGPYRADWQTQAKQLITAVRGGDMAQLNLGEDDPGHDVVAVLAFSYHDLRDDESRRRFRVLAAFAPEAPFRTDLAAAVWQCAADDAYEMLNRLANGALLERLGDGEWRQHGLLRAFALTLLRQTGEQEAAAAAHAAAYREAIRTADDAQRYYEMLPVMPQLRYAFAWALDNDLELALESPPTAPT